MEIGNIEGATRIFGKPPEFQGQCDSLPIRDVITPDGPFMISEWKPSEEEIEAMKNGATIKLWIHGSEETKHPIVALSIGDL